MPPQITCPNCGSTINLENRKEVDFEKIIHALYKSSKTFTELLSMTNLPRKTLSLRLKDLCSSGAIVKDGGYHLSASFASKHKIHGKKNGNGKMKGTILHVGKNIQWMPVALIVCLFAMTFGSALLLSSPPPEPSPPMAAFGYIPSYNLVAGQILTFDASASRDSDGYITSYLWDFGDGIMATSKVVTHNYQKSGVYYVTLTVADNEGLLSTSQPKAIYIFANSEEDVIPPPDDGDDDTPSARDWSKMIIISPDPRLPGAGWENQWFVNRLLTFDSSWFNEVNGFAGAHMWDFGDSSAPEIGVVVTHAFKEAGEYSIALAVTDLNGNTRVITQKIPVLSIPATTIYVDPVSSGYQVGDIITLNIMISDVSELWSWQAGVTFNAEVLRCVSSGAPDNAAGDPSYTALTEGDFLRQAGYTLWFVGGFDNEAGVIVAHGCTLTAPATPVAGSGVLATVTFEVIGEGDFDLHLTSVKLINGIGEEIPVYVAT